jgi:hypothetical protein
MLCNFVIVFENDFKHFQLFNSISCFLLQRRFAFEQNQTDCNHQKNYNTRVQPTLLFDKELKSDLGVWKILNY